MEEGCRMYTNDEIRKELSQFYENLQTYAEWLDAAENELKNYFFQTCGNYYLDEYNIFQSGFIQFFCSSNLLG